MLNDGDLPTEDFHLINSYPCWAYTNRIGPNRNAVWALVAEGLTIRYFIFLAFFMLILVSLEVSARGSYCHSECKVLFRDLSFGSPLIGLFYLIAPIFGFVAIFGKNAKTKESLGKSSSKKAGRTFYVLALISLLLILVVEFART